MGLNKPFDRDMFVLDGLVMKNGWSLQLAKGQFGIFDTTKTSVNGLKAVSTFKGRPSNIKYELKVGRTDAPVTRSNSNKNFSSFPFTVKDIIDLKVSAPEKTKMSVDKVVVGYDGLNDDTAITFTPGTRYNMVVRLSGEPVGMLGYKQGYVDIPITMEADECPPYDSCQRCSDCGEVPALPIVKNAVETLRNFNLLGGVKASELIDATITKKCNTNPTLTSHDYKFHTLTLVDLGDDNSLALVQAQYPNYKVIRIDRQGVKSTYQLLAPSADTIVPYEQKLPSLIKGCEDCPSGYTEVAGGLIYAVSLEDDGEDKTADVQAIPYAVAGTAVKSETQNDGVGYYTVVLTQELTDAEITTWVDAHNTATIELVGEVASICQNGTVTTTNWVDGDTCQVAEVEYHITLPDNECGQNRLAELQAHYPELTISLEGTTGGCQTKYKAIVNSNLVCDACSPEFKDYFKGKAPSEYEGNKWVQVTDLDGSDCKVGILITGKEVSIYPDEYLKDTLGFVESSVKIQVSGGFEREVRAGEKASKVTDNNFSVKYLSKAVDRQNVGGRLWYLEDKGLTFFGGDLPHKDYVAKTLTGENTVVNPSAQYVDYAITIQRPIYSQSFNGTSKDINTYHIFVEVGKHKEVEDILNLLAAENGLAPVKAYAG